MSIYVTAVDETRSTRTGLSRIFNQILDVDAMILAGGRPWEVLARYRATWLEIPIISCSQRTIELTLAAYTQQHSGTVGRANYTLR